MKWMKIKYLMMKVLMVKDIHFLLILLITANLLSRRGNGTLGLGW